MKEPTSIQARLFQFWIFVALIYGTANLIFGIGLLTRGRLFSDSKLVVSLLDSSSFVWTPIFLWALYQSLAFARDSGDLQIRRPFIWLIISFFPLINLYTSFAVYPRIFPAWIKWMSHISTSSNQALTFMLLTSCSSILLKIEAPEALVLSLLVEGIAKVSLVWVLRDVVLHGVPNR